MSDQPSGYEPPVLESYSVEFVPLPPSEAREATAAPARQRLQITLRGSKFVVRAKMPIIMIGNMWVKEYQVMPDERTIVCYLDELPEEGATISISYGEGKCVELPEPFSWKKVPGGRPPSEGG
jgi:hypothetical protein